LEATAEDKKLVWGSVLTFAYKQPAVAIAPSRDFHQHTYLAAL
jgi:hypothetical protein